MFLPPFLQSLPDASEAKQVKKKLHKKWAMDENRVLDKNENLDPLRLHRQMCSRKAPTRGVSACSLRVSLVPYYCN